MYSKKTEERILMDNEYKHLNSTYTIYLIIKYNLYIYIYIDYTV